MSRDWQKDMEWVNNYKHAKTLVNVQPMFLGQTIREEPDILVLEYWLQQYAHQANEVCYWKGEAQKERERADDLQIELTDLETRYLHLEEHSLKQKFKLAEEKQRADIAELAYKEIAEDGVSRGEYESLLDKYTAMTKAHKAAEASEKKLREAIERAIKCINVEAFRTACNELEGVLTSLYPLDKEEEV